MQHTLVIFHSEEEYAYSLMNYMNQHREFAFRVIAFTQKQLLCDYMKQHKVQILLFDESILEDELSLLKIPCCLALTDNPTLLQLYGRKVIFMYQPARKIMSQVTEYYASEGNHLPNMKTAVKTKLEAICGVSIGWRQSWYALNYASELAKEKRVLFVSFHPNMEVPFFQDNKEYFLSEAIYTFKMNDANVGYKLSQIVKEHNGFHYLTGVEHFSDLNELNIEEATSFIDELAQKGGYDVILIDLPMPCFNITGLLLHCENVYELVEGHSFAEQMRKEFYRQMELKEGQGVLSSFIEVPMESISIG